MSKEKKREISLNIGTSSILFIFVILSLVSFAILSLVSAMSDYRLSKDIADNTSSYYFACNEIETLIAQTDSSLKEVYDSGISRVGYYDKVGRERSFAYPMSDKQSLEVSIDILYPEVEGDPFYKITSWHVVTTGNYELDDTLSLFK